MLPPFIIDQIRRREERELEERARAVLELPVPTSGSDAAGNRDSDTPPRGIVVIDL